MNRENGEDFVRNQVLFASLIMAAALAVPVAAQQFGPSSAMSGLGGNSGSASAFFSKSMVRPDVGSVMSFRPTVPTPLNFNMRSMMPSLPSLQDTLSLRNVFGSRPQMGFVQPKMPVPPKKK
jgi:hypothetical protein